MSICSISAFGQAAAARVVGERAADRDDEVGLLQVLEAGLGREAARDPDARSSWNSPLAGSVVDSSPPVLPANARQAPRLGFDRTRPASTTTRSAAATSCAALATSG